jgi:hypothetical protein
MSGAYHYVSENAWRELWAYKEQLLNLVKKGNYVERTYTDAEVRYFLVKSSAALEREVFGKGLPPGRVLTKGWEEFVRWRKGLPYAKCLRGLQPFLESRNWIRQ